MSKFHDWFKSYSNVAEKRGFLTISFLRAVFKHLQKVSNSENPLQKDSFKRTKWNWFFFFFCNFCCCCINALIPTRRKNQSHLNLNSLQVLLDRFLQWWDRLFDTKWFYSPSTQNSFCIFICNLSNNWGLDATFSKWP